MSLDEAIRLSDAAVRRSVEGMAGKALLASALALILAGVGFLHNEFSSLHAEVGEHSGKLATISQNIVDLTSAIRDHNTTTDAALNKLFDDDQKHAAAIATAEAELEDIRREPPRIIEREPMVSAPRATPLQQPFAPLGNALSHIFQPHHWRGRRP